MVELDLEVYKECDSHLGPILYHSMGTWPKLKKEDNINEVQDK